MYNSMLVTAFVILCLHQAASFSSGPPPNACITRTPAHGFDPQTGNCPYNLTAHDWIPGVATDSKFCIIICIHVIIIDTCYYYYACYYYLYAC